MTDRQRHDQGRRITIACPHCGEALRTRTSVRVSEITRSMIMACHNPLCAATFGADLSLTHQISVGARPNPSVELRQSPPRRQNSSPVNSSPVSGPAVPPPANDDAVRTISTG